VTAPTAESRGLAQWSLFAALIAAAGVPIYIYAPNFYAETYGIGLGTLGFTLLLLCLTDVVMDPFLGWFAETHHATRGRWVALAALAMAVAMFGLFAVPPPVAPLLWFAMTLTLLFTGFSFLTICFYAEGVGRADRMGTGGHMRLAAWRESGALIGISLAVVAPEAMKTITATPFAAFAAAFAALAVVAVLAMRQEWGRATALPPDTSPMASFRPALADPLARRLLLIALLNAAPVAVSSALFVFFVQSRLDAPGAEGPLLLLFFLAAAITTPVWSRAAARNGPKRILMIGMVLAILSFMWAATLGAGDVYAFAVICAAAGAALGADMTLLPAIFARRMASIGQGGEASAFGLWAFMSKLSLALAATLLAVLEASGFQSGTDNPPTALLTLSLLYAVLPCALKLAAIILLARTPIPEV
jgi:glycoside/pentoside/hexuronide:cation symporter, GPH family